MFNAKQIGSGTIGTARLGSGTANSGTVLHGDNTWKPTSASPWSVDGDNNIYDNRIDTGYFYNSEYNTVLGYTKDEYDTILHNAQSSLVWGYSARVFSGGGIAYSNHNIVLGYKGDIHNSGEYSLKHNTILGGLRSLIHGTYYHTAYNTIIGGYYNRMKYGGLHNTIIGGYYNYIYYGSHSTIIGCENYFMESYYNTVAMPKLLLGRGDNATLTLSAQTHTLHYGGGGEVTKALNITANGAVNRIQLSDGAGNFSSSADFTFLGTAGVKFPTGTNAQRGATAAALRYNSQTFQAEVHTGLLNNNGNHAIVGEDRHEMVDVVTGNINETVTHEFELDILDFIFGTGDKACSLELEFISFDPVRDLSYAVRLVATFYTVTETTPVQVGSTQTIYEITDDAVNPPLVTLDVNGDNVRIMITFGDVQTRVYQYSYKSIFRFNHRKLSS